MPPIIALLIGISFIIYLLWHDIQQEPRTSKALWIPFLWIFFAGSRYFSYWIGSGPPGPMGYHEGSPIDAVVFGILILSAVFVIARRKIDWELLAKKNKWILVYFSYCFISITWSDFPFIALKRFIKEIGNPILILVILTDSRPYDAFVKIIKRVAYIGLPLSIIFYKYFPSLGRAFHPNGTMFATGVSMGKNGLGMLCLICGTVLIWDRLLRNKNNIKRIDRSMLIDYSLLGMVAWLMYHSDSATSLVCLLLAIILTFACRLRVVSDNPGRIITILLICVPSILLMEEALDVSSVILYFLDRDPSYTTRVPMWEFLRQMAVNELIGAGYQSFWLGDRLTEVWEYTVRTINQAHNGFLEQYLNLGYFGLILLFSIIVSGILKIKRKLYEEYEIGVLCLTFLVISLLYNFTEAAFYGINNLWMLLLLSVMEVAPQGNPQEENVPIANIDEKAESRI